MEKPNHFMECSTIFLNSLLNKGLSPRNALKFAQRGFTIAQSEVRYSKKGRVH
jgi:hypothetical protein